MGRLASRYADLDILARFPYAMDSELSLATAQTSIPFNDSDFLNVQDKVFEVHRMIPRVYGLDADGLFLATQPSNDLMEGLCLLDMNLQGFNQLVTKSPVRIGAIIKGTSEKTWEYAEPFYLPNGRGLQIKASTVSFPAGATFTKLLIVVNFEGFLLQLAPPRGV